jgi:hypothetical protein
MEIQYDVKVCSGFPAAPDFRFFCAAGMAFSHATGQPFGKAKGRV